MTRLQQYYIGWDVGGWNCDRNSRSRDALVILDQDRAILGTPWRGNLRETLNTAETSRDWLTALFALCKVGPPALNAGIVIAIDTPLGFSDAFTRLATRLEAAGPVGDSKTNPYLFRATERFLFDRGLTPLSSVKDMIGSQATKGMHFLARFAPDVTACGVWSDGAGLTAIEAYPSACRKSSLIDELTAQYVTIERNELQKMEWIEGFDHEDKRDALTCALIAWIYTHDPDALAQPGPDVPASEGWIWVPMDGLSDVQNSKSTT